MAYAYYMNRARTYLAVSVHNMLHTLSQMHEAMEYEEVVTVLLLLLLVLVLVLLLLLLLLLQEMRA